MLLLKCALVAMPAGLLALAYWWFDPYKVVHPQGFDNYYNWQPFELNRDFVSTQNFKAGQQSKPFDAFIFGSSRSFVYRTQVWEQFLPAGSRAYHFDALSETLFGVSGKVKLILASGAHPKNVLLILDESLLKSIANDKDVIHIKHPDVSGESRYAFQSVFLKSYFTDFFFKRYLQFRLTGNRDAFKGTAFQIKPNYFTTEGERNNFYYTGYDSLLHADSVGYYREHADVFDVRKGKTQSDAVIGEAQQAMLHEIASALQNENTRVEVIVNPLYDQIRMHPRDCAVLEQVFGAAHVHNFSGVNEYTSFMGNYYDPMHYKEPVAISILQKIYR